jgi:nitrate/nitrite transporter NarK
LPATFLTGTAAAAGIGLINSISSLGRFIGPWMVGVLKEQSGGYSSAMAAFGTIMLASVLLFIVMGRRMSVRKLAPG